MNWLVGTLPVTAMNGTEFEIGVRQRDRQVGGAGAAGGEGRRGAARNTVVNVGHETGDALVMHGDRLDVVRALVERVDELDIAVAAQAEGVGDFLADQIIDNDLRAIELVAP